MSLDCYNINQAQPNQKRFTSKASDSNCYIFLTYCVHLHLCPATSHLSSGHTQPPTPRPKPIVNLCRQSAVQSSSSRFTSSFICQAEKLYMWILYLSGSVACEPGNLKNMCSAQNHVGQILEKSFPKAPRQ